MSDNILRGQTTGGSRFSVLKSSVIAVVYELDTDAARATPEEIEKQKIICVKLYLKGGGAVLALPTSSMLGFEPEGMFGEHDRRGGNGKS